MYGVIRTTTPVLPWIGEMKSTWRKCTSSIWRIFAVLLMSFYLLQCRAETNKNTFSSGENDEDEVDLDSLTDAELEAICTDRGFELLREKGADGAEVVYTHEDYVDAAMQCLAIEAEM